MADASFWGPIIAAGVTVVGGVVSMLIQNGQRAAAEDLLKQAREELGDEDLPDLDEPEAQNYYLEQSRQAQTQESPVFQAVDSALSEISSGGETASEKAMREAGMRELQGRVSARSKQIQDNLAARGQGGGVAEVVGREAQVQDAADAANALQLQTQAQLQRRSLDALQQRQRNAESGYGRDFQRRQAQDLLDQENKRLQRQYNEDLNRVRNQGFENKRSLTATRSGQTNTLANFYNQNPTPQIVQKVTSGVGEGIVGVTDYLNKKKKKEEEEEGDLYYA